MWPDERVTRLKNLAWLMTGIYQSRSVHLSRIAGKIPGRAKLLSTVRRLSRFLDNPAVRVREWYAPIARGLLEVMAATVGEIRLIADGTKVGGGPPTVDHRRGLPPASHSHRLDMGPGGQGAQLCP